MTKSKVLTNLEEISKFARVLCFFFFFMSDHTLTGEQKKLIQTTRNVCEDAVC